MIDLRKVHERETFQLIGQQELSWPDVEPVFSEIGFVLTDDFVSLKRTGKIERWQSETLAHCDFLAAGKEVYPDECGFDLIRFSICVSTLPLEQVKKSLQVLHDLAEGLGLPVAFAGQFVTRVQADALVEAWSSDILAETGDVCGSESVRMLIEIEYDKRKA